MRFSIEPRDRRHVKDYGLLSFAKNIGKNISKNISNNYSQKLVDSAKKPATDAIKTASERAIQKAAGCTQKNLKSSILKNCHQMKLIMKYQKKDIYLHKKDNKLLMN